MPLPVHACQWRELSSVSAAFARFACQCQCTHADSAFVTPAVLLQGGDDNAARPSLCLRASHLTIKPGPKERKEKEYAAFARFVRCTHATTSTIRWYATTLNHPAVALRNRLPLSAEYRFAEVARRVVPHPMAKPYLATLRSAWLSHALAGLAGIVCRSH